MKKIISDIGSTTTKTILINEKSEMIGISKTPTTVEKPDEDVKIGLINSIKEIEKNTGEKLIKSRNNFDFELFENIDLFLTSSAGGGLEMVVVGLTDLYSGKIGKKVALGAGALVKDVIAGGDGRSINVQMQQLKKSLPDMILLVGGVNSENIANVCLKADFIRKAKIENKYKCNPVPILYAGNELAQQKVKEILSDHPLFVDKNVCQDFKTPDTRNLQKKINEIFFKHVMEDAPGYSQLKSKVSAKILPTPIAVSKTLNKLSKKHGNIILFDIGGATTDVFSFFEGRFYRSVSANIGMSYSIDNVFEKAGLKNLRKFLPDGISDKKILNYIGNKKLNPTSLAVGKDENAIESAIAINGIRFALEDHFRLFKGDFDNFRDSKKRIIVFKSDINYKQFIKSFGSVIGSGGIVSNNIPSESRRIILNSFEKKEIENLYLDKGFLFPHIGILMEDETYTAERILKENSLINLNEKLEEPKNKDFVEKKVQEMKLIECPEIVIKKKNRKFKVKKNIKKNTVLHSKETNPCRTYYYPIPIKKFSEVKYLPSSKSFKKGEDILKFETIGFERWNRLFTAPIPGEFKELKDYAFIYTEDLSKDSVVIDIDEDKVYSRRQKKKVINFLKDNLEELKKKFFYQNEILYSHRFRHVFVKSPISGKLIDFNEEKMELTFKRFPKQENIFSFASGEVIEEDNKEVKIKSEGKQIFGLMGVGDNLSGFLNKDITYVRNFSDFEEFLDSKRKAAIVETIPYNLYQKFLKNRNEKSLIIFKGFGEFSSSNKISDFIGRYKERELYFSPETRIRAGVKRPFIYFE